MANADAAKTDAAKTELPGDILVVAATTAVLKSLLDNGLVTYGLIGSLGGEVLTSVSPPDRITIVADSHSQLNLFLYQITQKGLGSISRFAVEGETAPLPQATVFELAYLVTAYGAQDYHAEILLGYAIEQLNSNPCLQGPQVRKMLETLSPNGGSHVASPAIATLARSSAARRFTGIRIAPQITTYQDMQNLWSTFQTPYRPSATYKVTIELSPALDPSAG